MRKDDTARKQVVVILDRELVKRIDHWAADRDLYRRHAIELLLLAALDGEDASGGARE